MPLHAVAITGQPGLQFCPQTLRSGVHSRVPWPPYPCIHRFAKPSAGRVTSLKSLLQVQAESREELGDGWPRLDDCQPHQLLTRDGKVTQRHVVRQERQRKEPSQSQGSLFFLCFTMRTGGPEKYISIVSSMTPSNGGNGLQHWSGSLRSLHGEKERGDWGTAPGQSAADAAPEKNGDRVNRAPALIHGVMKHPSIAPRPWCIQLQEHGSGTPHCWTIMHRTENDLDVDLGTCGCVDHRQNFGPQSVESINISAAHILV